MKTIAFAKRNIMEMIRDPLIYIFCISFPGIMIVLFSMINHYSGNTTKQFEFKSLIPGILVFSYTFVMLLMSLLVSNDRKTSLLKRLYISTMKPINFILGYVMPGALVGIIQSIFCVLLGYIISLILKAEYFSFIKSFYLILSQLPMLIICIFLGIFIGSIFNEKSAPGITSIFISLSGIFGGCWMPIDTMGDFEKFCQIFPFYPSVYWGRIIAEAEHTPLDITNSQIIKYEFDSVAQLGFIPVGIFFIASILLAYLVFKRQMTYR
mgnify:FL=1